MPSDIVDPSGWIKDQPWYLFVWRNDPTIQAMLVVIDAIHCQITEPHPGLDATAAWGRLTDHASPAISFYLLPLEDMESDEDLYIEMNSRGKPLTPFESFKARFEKDIAYSHRAREFARKVDGVWSDLLWPIHGGDYIVDDEFIRYFARAPVPERCLWTEPADLISGTKLVPAMRFLVDSPVEPFIERAAIACRLSWR